MRRWILIVVLAAAAGAASAQTLLVAAAANLATVEAPLKQAFTKANPGMTLAFTYGASGALVTQILNGAPFQAFLSADRAFAQRLVDASLAVGPVQTFAVGKVVFLALKPLDLTRGLAVLLDPAVAQVALANPDTAPYGKAAVEALMRAKLYDRVRAKLVLGQSVAQAVQFAVTTTGFGFANKSALFTKELLPFNQEGRYWFEVDQGLYAPMEQGFVVLKSAAALPEAQAFAAFLLSPEAQKVFAASGYGPP
jgi:molybdate transport system substrate-binding protein